MGVVETERENKSVFPYLLEVVVAQARVVHVVMSCFPPLFFIFPRRQTAD